MRVAPHDWHVQAMGEGPVALLIHGSGGAAHSWRGVMPLLARRLRIVAVDLPGQGFTRAGRPRYALPEMAADLGALAQAEGWTTPRAVVGHSAGAAVALAMALDGPVRPERIVGINAALGSFKGPAGVVFPMIAKALVANPLTGFAMSRLASERLARRMLAGMGSEVDAEGLACYAHLFGRPGHVQATLRMMARWDLAPLRRRLDEVEVPTLLITGAGDTAVPPSVSEEAARRMRDARVATLPGGHLVHEEAPEAVCALIEAFLDPA